MSQKNPEFGIATPNSEGTASVWTKERLEQEWRAQASRAGVLASGSGLSLEDYLELLPEFLPQQDENLTRPLIIPACPDLGFAVNKIAQICHIENINYLFDDKDLEDPNRFPSKPYTIWVGHPVEQFISPGNFRDICGDNARLGNAVEGLALLLQYPTIVRRSPLVIPGSKVDADFTPSLWFRDGKIFVEPLDDRRLVFQNQWLLAGRQINT